MDIKQHCLPTCRWPVEGHTPDRARREIYTKQRGVVKTLVRAARKLHFSARSENCSNTKQLFSVSNGLLGKSKTTPSRLTYHVLHFRTDFACFSLKKSRTSGKTLMLILLNQKHSLSKNFRPVSNLPFISKILEKVVLTQL